MSRECRRCLHTIICCYICGIGPYRDNHVAHRAGANVTWHCVKVPSRTVPFHLCGPCVIAIEHDARMHRA